MKITIGKLEIIIKEDGVIIKNRGSEPVDLQISEISNKEKVSKVKYGN